MAVQPCQRRRRKPMGEMNVVPYIDVMLVLLVIFMATAPLLSQGVKVELPQADAQPAEYDENKPPIIVTIDAEGAYSIELDGNPPRAVEPRQLSVDVTHKLRLAPKTPVYVRGDKGVAYGEVVIAMALLQEAGAESVGLLTETPDE